MTKQTGEEFLKPYREAIQRFGPSFEATLWQSREAQELRFDVMIDLACFGDCVIVDAGCGQGDFAARLIEREIHYSHFIGIDAVGEMIDLARKRNLLRCQFVASDLISEESVFEQHQPDFVCFSGTLNTMTEQAAKQLVKQAFEASAQGVIFNFLSDRHHKRYAGKDLYPASRFNTLGMLEWAFGLTSKVSFTQAYLDGHDATIMIQHDE